MEEGSSGRGGGPSEGRGRAVVREVPIRVEVDPAGPREERPSVIPTLVPGADQRDYGE